MSHKGEYRKGESLPQMGVPILSGIFAVPQITQAPADFGIVGSDRAVS